MYVSTIHLDIFFQFYYVPLVTKCLPLSYQMSTLLSNRFDHLFNILCKFIKLSSYQTAGVCRIHTNIKFGERWNTLKGFIRPALGRRNLDMVTDAHVSKVRHRITKRDNSLSLYMYSIFVDCRT